MSTVKINVTTLTKQVEEGMKKPELSTFYGISELQMGRALKQAGLKIRKFQAPAFELVTEETNVAEVDGGTIEGNLTTEEITDGLENEVTTEEKEGILEGPGLDEETVEATTDTPTWSA